MIVRKANINDVNKIAEYNYNLAFLFNILFHFL